MAVAPKKYRYQWNLGKWMDQNLRFGLPLLFQLEPQPYHEHLACRQFTWNLPFRDRVPVLGKTEQLKKLVAADITSNVVSILLNPSVLIALSTGFSRELLGPPAPY